MNNCLGTEKQIEKREGKIKNGLKKKDYYGA